MKRRYSLSKIVEKINSQYVLNLNEADIKGTVKQLIKAGFTDIVDITEVGSIKETLLSINKVKARYNPLKVEASLQVATQLNNTEICPLCLHDGIVANHLIEVKLAGNRKAQYCTEHNVAIPCSV